jgi:hypothetical protein
MKKVPYYAGVSLAGVIVVAALNWDARVPVETPYAVPVPWTLSGSETVQLFSAFGAETETDKPEPPYQPSSISPDVKLPPKKPPKVQPSMKGPAKSTAGNTKRQPTVVNASGHIL